MLSNHTISSIKAASLFGPNQVSISCPLAIFRNLLRTDFVHRIAGWRRVEDFIPLGRHLQAFVYREDAVPGEFGMGFVAVQFEKLRLVKGLRVGEVFPGTIAPVFYKAVGHCGDGQVDAVFGAEVPGAGIFLWILP